MLNTRGLARLRLRPPFLPLTPPPPTNFLFLRRQLARGTPNRWINMEAPKDTPAAAPENNKPKSAKQGE